MKKYKSVVLAAALSSSFIFVGCMSKPKELVVPDVTINAPKNLPEPPDTKVDIPKEYPTQEQIFSYLQRISFSDTKANGEPSDKSFKIPENSKLAVAMFKSPDVKNVNGTIAADIMYLNFIRHGFSVVERDTIAKIISENDMIKSGSVQISEKEMLSSLDRLKNTDFLVIGTLSQVTREPTLIDFGYFYKKIHGKNYKKQLNEINKKITLYNNEIYPVIKNTAWPLNNQIRVHNYSIMLRAQKNNDFLKEFNDHYMSDPDVSSKDQKEIQALLDYKWRTRYRDSMANRLDVLYPKLDTVLNTITAQTGDSFNILEQANIKQHLQSEANKKLSDNDTEAAEKLLKAVEEREKELNRLLTINKFKIKSEDGKKMNIGDFILDGNVKQLIVKRSAFKKYGIKMQSDKSLLIPYVDEYNNRVRFFNRLLAKTSIPYRLKEAVTFPALIPLLDEDDLEIPSMQVQTPITNINFSFKVVDSKTSDIKLVVEGSRDDVSMTAALNSVFDQVINHISK